MNTTEGLLSSAELLAERWLALGAISCVALQRCSLKGVGLQCIEQNKRGGELRMRQIYDDIYDGTHHVRMLPRSHLRTRSFGSSGGI